MRRYGVLLEIRLLETPFVARGGYTLGKRMKNRSTVWLDLNGNRCECGLRDS